MITFFYYQISVIFTNKYIDNQTNTITNSLPVQILPVNTFLLTVECIIDSIQGPRETQRQTVYRSLIDKKGKKQTDENRIVFTEKYPDNRTNKNTERKTDRQEKGRKSAIRYKKFLNL